MRVLGALAFMPHVVAAQSPAARTTPAYTHETWTVENGLPVNHIIGLLQDRQGYIWAATFDGLVRFDGVRFTVFNTANSAGLPGNRIILIQETRDGTLWLQTEQRQLVRFRDGRFTHVDAQRGLSHPVQAVYEDTTGRLWVGTAGGLGYLDGDRFVPIVSPEPPMSVGNITGRRDGSVWLAGLPAGLYRFADGRLTSVAAPGFEKEVNLFHEAPDGTLWIATPGSIWIERNGLQRVASTQDVGSVEQLMSLPGTNHVVAYSASGVVRISMDGTVTPIDTRKPVQPYRLLGTDKDNNLWHAHGSALYRNGTLAQTLGDGASRRVATAAISSALFDREGSLWLGTQGTGLHRLKAALFTTYSEAEGIAERNINTIYQDRAGSVLIGTRGGGISRIDSSGTISAPAEALVPTYANVTTIYQERSGRLLIGTGSGLFTCLTPRTACTRVNNSPEALAIDADAEGRTWIGTTSGVLRADGEMWTRFPASAGAPTNPVRAFARTGDGALWMGMNGGGVVRFSNGVFTRVTAADGLPIDIIRALYVDADGWLWVGTEGRGLARLDPREWAGASVNRPKRIVQYRNAHGLFDEVIHQILEDNYGRLWMSTNRGIFWVARSELNAFAEGRTRTIHSTAYTERDGLRNREANGGSQPAGIKSSDGRLWFPTQDGVAVVDPARLEASRLPPPVVIERVTAGDSTRVASGGALHLGVDQRDLQIEYTALSFLEPANVRFRYRLEPYDRDWVDAGNRRTAFYTRVPPGRYAFRVTASNNEGVWNEQGAALELALAPHFWETGVFRFSLLLLMGLTGVAALRWRDIRLRQRARELEHIVSERTSKLREHEQQLAAQNTQLEAQAGQLREMDQAKSRLFTNLSHEFRTPLTLILGPLRALLDGSHGTLSSGAREQGEMMQRNAQRMLRLINQVLDLAKLQARQVKLDRRTQDLVSFARSSTLAFAPLAERRGIALRFESKVPELLLAFDAEQLEKVLLNLLSNALKFTATGGQVELSVKADAAAAEIVVRDTGVGIAPEHLSRVFDRFYQADSTATRRFEGTGIGLALVKELVDLHGGELRAESTPGVGSTFTVRLPREDGIAAVAGAPDGERALIAAPDVDEADAITAEPQEPADEDRTTILVIDDNADVRTYVKSVLGSSYRIIEAGDGRAGLESARTSLPDLIVADIMMPELDGLALSRALKTDAMTDTIPVILLTARAGAEDQVAGLETGADAYVVKPFDPAVLEAHVANLLAQRRRLRERFRQGEETVAPIAAPRSKLEQKLRSVVEKALHDPEFGPEQLAAGASLSYHQLYRALRDELHTTPSRFLRAVRVEYAAELLRRRAGTITEIAYSVGFESLSYFGRAYRERFGCAPSEHLASPIDVVGASRLQQ